MYAKFASGSNTNKHRAQKAHQSPQSADQGGRGFLNPTNADKKICACGNTKKPWFNKCARCQFGVKAKPVVASKAPVVAKQYDECFVCNKKKVRDFNMKCSDCYYFDFVRTLNTKVVKKGYPSTYYGADALKLFLQEVFIPKMYDLKEFSIFVNFVRATLESSFTLEELIDNDKIELGKRIGRQAICAVWEQMGYEDDDVMVVPLLKEEEFYLNRLAQDCLKFMYQNFDEPAFIWQKRITKKIKKDWRLWSLVNKWSEFTKLASVKQVSMYADMDFRSIETVLEQFEFFYENLEWDGTTYIVKCSLKGGAEDSSTVDTDVNQDQPLELYCKEVAMVKACKDVIHANDEPKKCTDLVHVAGLGMSYIEIIPIRMNGLIRHSDVKSKKTNLKLVKERLIEKESIVANTQFDNRVWYVNLDHTIHNQLPVNDVLPKKEKGKNKIEQVNLKLPQVFEINEADASNPMMGKILEIIRSIEDAIIKLYGMINMYKDKIAYKKSMLKINARVYRRYTRQVRFCRYKLSKLIKLFYDTEKQLANIKSANMQLLDAIKPFNEILKGKGADDKYELENYRQVAVGIIYANNSILLGKRGPDSNPDFMVGLYAAPGGKREIEDESIVDTLRREVFEETGIKIKNAIPLNETGYKAFNGTMVYHFLVTDFENEPIVPASESRKVDSWEWITVDEAMQLPLVPGALEILIKMRGCNPIQPASIGYDPNFIERIDIPEGFFPIFVNNKDDLCTIHAINLQLPKENQIDINKFKDIVPTEGFSPLDFVPIDDLSIYSDGQLKIGRGRTAFNLLWSKNGNFGHYDALIPIDRLGSIINNVNVYPNGKSSLVNVKNRAAIVMSCGKDPIVELKPRVIKIANLETYIASPLTVEPEVVISDRSDIFADIETDERLSKAIESSVDISKMARVLYGNTNSFRGQRYATNSYAMTAQLDTDIREGDGVFPATVHMDFSGYATRDDIDRVESTLTAITQGVNYKAITDNLSPLLPNSVGAGDVNNTRDQERRLKHLLNNKLNSFEDTSPNNWKHYYGRLISGFLGTSMGICMAPPNTNQIVGNQLFDWANVPVGRRVPNAYRFPQARERADAPIAPYQLAQMIEMITDTNLTPDENGNVPICIIPQTTYANASDFPYEITNADVHTNHNPYVVLANFWRPNLGFIGQTYYNNAAYNSFINRYRLCPRIIMTQSQGRHKFFSDNDGNIAQAFTAHTLLNPKSWMDAIILMLSTVGSANDFYEAWTEVVARSFAFFDATQTDLHCSSGMTHDLRCHNNDDTNSALSDIMWNRLMVMRANYPLAAHIEANNANNNATRWWNSVQMKYTTAYEGPIIHAGHANVVANAQAIFDAQFDTATTPYANLTPVAAVHAVSTESAADAAWFASMNKIRVDQRAGMDQFLGSLNLNETSNAILWITDNTFAARWGCAHGDFGNFKFHLDALLTGKNNNLVNNPITRRQAIENHYYINREGLKTVTNLNFETVSTVPVGLTAIRRYLVDGDAFNTDTYAIQTASLLRGFSIPQVNWLDANLVAERWRTILSTTDDRRNNFLLISMNMAIQMRCAVDAVAAVKGLSYSMLSTFGNRVSFGDTRIDDAINVMEYGLKRGKKQEYMNDYSKGVLATIQNLGYPLYITNVDGNMITRTHFNRTNYYEYNANANYVGMNGDNINNKFQLKSYCKDYVNANWRVMHPMIFEMFTSSQAKWGALIRSDFKLIRSMVPNAYNPWTGYAISDAAGSPLEMLGAMSANLFALDKYLSFRMTFSMNTTNNDYDPTLIKNFVISPNMLSTQPKRSSSYPHNPVANQVGLYYLATPLKLLPSLLTENVRDRVTVATIEPTCVIQGRSMMYTSYIKHCNFPSFGTNLGEKQIPTWDRNAWIDNAPEAIQKHGFVGNTVTPIGWNAGIFSPQLMYGRGWSTIATPLTTNLPMAVSLNGRTRHIAQPTIYQERNSSYYNYIYGGQKAGLRLTPKIGGMDYIRDEFYMPLDNTGAHGTFGIRRGESVYDFGIGLHRTSIHGMSNANTYQLWIPEFTNRLRRCWFRLSLENPSFRLYGSNDSVSFENTNSSIPTPSGRNAIHQITHPMVKSSVKGVESKRQTTHINLVDTRISTANSTEVPVQSMLNTVLPGANPDPPVIEAKNMIANIVNDAKKTTGIKNNVNGQHSKNKNNNVIKITKDIKTSSIDDATLEQFNEMKALAAKNAEEIAKLQAAANELADMNKKLQETIKQNNEERKTLETEIKELKNKKEDEPGKNSIDENNLMNILDQMSKNNIYDSSQHSNNTNNNMTNGGFLPLGWVKGSNQQTSQ